MWNTHPTVHGLTNLWVREQQHLGGPIREIETRTIGRDVRGDEVDGLLLDHRPPLRRVMDWRFYPSEYGYPFWWADLEQIGA